MGGDEGRSPGPGSSLRAEGPGTVEPRSPYRGTVTVPSRDWPSELTVLVIRRAGQAAAGGGGRATESSVILVRLSYPGGSH
eukprot:225020-Hanusia_phi.AAC.1